MIIGIFGKMQVGKTTIGEYLQKEHGFKNMSFADPLKAACREIFSLSDEQLYGSLKDVIDEEWKLSPRHILQFVGTDLFRDQFDKDIWVKAAVRKIKKEKNTNWVLSDMRFLNEVNAVKDIGGYIVKVTRPTAKSQKNTASHISENELNYYRQYDFLLENDGTLDHLYKSVDVMLMKAKV